MEDLFTRGALHGTHTDAWVTLSLVPCVSWTAGNNGDVTFPVLAALGKAWGRTFANCSQATGLTCDDKGMVIEMSLNNTQLTGSIPSVIGKLSLLAHLNLGANQLTGVIPNSIGSLTSLSYLGLYNNQLAGPIPKSLAALASLQTLNLDNNLFSGSLPSTLSALSSATYLSISDNLLNGSLPDAIGALSALQSLGLANNTLSGPLPTSLANLTNLVTLGLTNNSLSGRLPSSISSLGKLEKLNLGFNLFTGALPNSIWHMTALTRIRLRNTSLSGPIPPRIGELRRLRQVDLSNTGISGVLPESMGHLDKLTELYMHGCRLNGPLPALLGNLTALQTLDLGSNHLSGEIPLFISYLTRIETLDLSANQLTGMIPDTVSSMQRLRQLDLSSNSLTGSVPSTTALLTNLTSLDLSHNNLSGTIPAFFSTLTSLHALDMSYNQQLSGSIPATLGQLSNLTVLATNATSTTCPLPSTPCEVPQSPSSAFCQACPEFCSSCCTSCTDPCTSYPSNPCGPGDCIPTSSPPTPASASTKGVLPPTSSTFSAAPPNSSYTCRCSAGAAAAVGANGLPTCVIPSPPPPQESSSAVAMPTGAIIGIAVASFAVIVCCFTLIFLCWRWRHTSQSRELVNQGWQAEADRSYRKDDGACADYSSGTHCSCAAPSPLYSVAAPRSSHALSSYCKYACSAQQRSGSAQQQSGSAQQQSGSAQQQSGSAQQQSGSAQQRSGAAQPGAMLAGFEYPEHVCGAAWRDEYAQLHARIRAASRAAWRARQPPASPPPPPAAPPPPPSAPPPQPGAEPRRRLAADASPPGAEPAAPAVRFLTYDWYGSCGGLGDYLIGLVTLFPAALLDRRALLVAQPCMHAAFRSPHIDTALSPDVPMGGGRPLLRRAATTPPPLDAAAAAARDRDGANASAGDGGGGGDRVGEDDDSLQRAEWLAPPCERLEGNMSAAGALGDSNSNSSAVPCLDLLRHTFEMEALQQLSALRNYRVRYNKGLLITTLLHDQGPWANALRQLGFKVAYGFRCILRFLFSPRPEVWNLLVGLEEQLWGEGVVRVAVHVRVPDREVWQNDGMTAQNTTQQQLDDLIAKANSTLQCAQAVENFWYPPPLKVKWILITNSHLLKQALKAKYPHKVVTTDFISWHSAQATEHEHTDLSSSSSEERDAALRGLQHFRETVAEWALIASSHAFIIPVSGFSRTAALYALRPLSIYVPPPLYPPKAAENSQKPPPPNACDPEKPAAIDRFGVTWSGI
ncbi:unnamed protein product [Closterium sp. Yama58-4]|nr:unnamed protein product [Closterium sp. Yama58-4]